MSTKDFYRNAVGRAGELKNKFVAAAIAFKDETVALHSMSFPEKAEYLRTKSLLAISMGEQDPRVMRTVYARTMAIQSYLSLGFYMEGAPLLSIPLAYWAASSALLTREFHKEVKAEGQATGLNIHQLHARLEKVYGQDGIKGTPEKSGNSTILPFRLEAAAAPYIDPVDDMFPMVPLFGEPMPSLTSMQSSDGFKACMQKLAYCSFYPEIMQELRDSIGVLAHDLGVSPEDVVKQLPFTAETSAAEVEAYAVNLKSLWQRTLVAGIDINASTIDEQVSLLRSILSTNAAEVSGDLRPGQELSYNY